MAFQPFEVVKKKEGLTLQRSRTAGIGFEISGGQTFEEPPSNLENSKVGVGYVFHTLHMAIFILLVIHEDGKMTMYPQNRAFWRGVHGRNKLKIFL